MGSYVYKYIAKPTFYVQPHRRTKIQWPVNVILEAHPCRKYNNKKQQPPYRRIHNSKLGISVSENKNNFQTQTHPDTHRSTKKTDRTHAKLFSYIGQTNRTPHTHTQSETKVNGLSRTHISFIHYCVVIWAKLIRFCCTRHMCVRVLVWMATFRP